MLEVAILYDAHSLRQLTTVNISNPHKTIFISCHRPACAIIITSYRHYSNLGYQLSSQYLF